MALSAGAMAAILGGGCVSDSSGPEVLTVSAAEYPQAFDAAAEVARRAGMPAALRDRRGGVIETQPNVAGSVLEPWRADNASLDQAVENTVAYQRRRARFEFAPAGATPAGESPPSSTQPLPGPDVIGAGEETTVDLSQVQGNLDLRVWVFIERADVPGVRRSTWTRSKTTQSMLVYPEGMKERPKGIVINWRPVARDPDYERRLLREVHELLAQQAAQETSVTESTPASVPSVSLADG
jgi:hypothetical protein